VGRPERDICAGRNEEERVSNIVISGQHAIDTWESEGGSLVIVPGVGLGSARVGRDFGRAALADNAGWRASNSAGWWASDRQKTYGKKR
jgi:hypothetical protein